MNERKLMQSNGNTDIATRPMSGETFQTFAQEVSKQGLEGHSSLIQSNMMS
jgi:hypothetical protein